MPQSQQQKARSWFFWICVSALPVAGCGGGGGGGSDTPASPGQPGSKAQTPAEQVPLAINAASAVNAAHVGIGEIEFVLASADEAVRTLRNLDMSASSRTLACSNQDGKKTINLSDPDLNRAPSAGDVFTVNFSDCRDDNLDRLIDGQLIVSVLSTYAVPGYSSSLSGNVQFSGFRVLSGALSTVPFELSGTVAFSNDVQDLAETFSVTAAAGNLKLTVRSPDKLYEEAVILSTAKKMLRHDRADYTVTLDTTLQSQYLSGQVKVTTPTAITGPLDSFPTQGNFRVEGSSTVDIQPAGANATVVFSDTVTNASNIGSRPWTDFSSLWFFWDSNHGDTRDVKLTAPDVLYTSIPDSGALPVNLSIALQLSRPLASSSIPAFLFQPQPPAAPINASVDYKNARLIVTTLTPLEPGTAYTLVPSNSGNFVDANGNPLVIGSYTFTTQSQ